MKKLIILALTVISTFAFAECEYFDGEGKPTKLDSSKVPNGASVEASSVNQLPSDLKSKLYDGSMTKCVTCTKNYIKCSK
jgi:hypothetical protein